MEFRVGHAEDFEVAKIKVMEVGGRSIGIVRTGENIRAVLNVCPHELAAVCEGVVQGTMMASAPGEVAYGQHNSILRCPWHRWEFDLEDDGRSIVSNYNARVRMFPVSVNANGDVIVELPDPLARRVRPPDTGVERTASTTS